MARKQVLQLVEDKGGAPSPRRTVLESAGFQAEDLHSLHGAVHFPWGARPELADFCIKRYSDRGSVVYDPFCGRGAVPLQAAALGRVPLGGDENPLAAVVAESKLQPVGLDEVVLGLHLVPFQRPVEMRPYRETFFPFYHPDTFRELVNLREYLRGRSDRLSRFLLLLGLSRLHGHMPGHLSAYSAPQLSLTPDRQLQLNRRRRETPEYRAVAPRLIRRAAQVLQDGISSDFVECARQGWVRRADPRRNDAISADSVDCIVSALPEPGCANPLDEHWLPAWFAGTPGHRLSFAGCSLPVWQSEVRRVLEELLRVARVGATASFIAGDIDVDGERLAIDDILAELCRKTERSGKCFRVEEVLVYPIGASTPSPRGRIAARQTRILTLRILRRSR